MVTPFQQKVYDFIRSYLAQHTYSPSLEEIARGIGISPTSISLISRSIRVLVDAGKLQQPRKGYRNLQLVGTSDNINVSLPLIGRIAAGEPIEALEDTRHIDLGALFKDPSYFVLEVKGDSMVDEGIRDGDLVICKPVSRAGEGDIVVALIDDQDATLKRISYKIAGMVTLIPANTQLKPKAYQPHRIHVQGVFVGLLRMKE